jgi:hypothetical protein
MNLKMAAFGLMIGLVGALAPAPAHALYQGDWVKLCQGGYADGNYQVTCWWEYHGGGDGGGGGYDPYDPYDGGGGGGGGGSGGYTAPSDQYTVGTFHCDDCVMTDQIGQPANGTIATFIVSTVNQQVSSWQASNGTLKNVVICNGDCFKYQYVAGGNWIRSL